MTNSTLTRGRHAFGRRARKCLPSRSAGFISTLLVLAAGPARAATPEPVTATDGMVVTESPEASLVGARILADGGNAVDAAVAVIFALAVTYPEAGNLGGGGFMLVRGADGSSEAIDFRETAPETAYRDLFLGADGRPDSRLSTETLLGSGVPGTVAGAFLAHERHGTVAWADLLRPAIDLAERGFPVDRYTAGRLLGASGRLSRHRESARIFLRNGNFYREGEVLRQPELAGTIRRLAESGSRDFYEGETARLLVAEMARSGGITTEQDLRGYRPKIRPCLEGSYRGLKILTMPPPSSGGIALLQMLGLLEPYPFGGGGAGSSGASHLLAEVMKRAFADRATYLADADFAPVPVQGLLSKAYLDSIRAHIDSLHATASGDLAPGRPPGAERFFAATGGDPRSGVGGRSGSGHEGGQTTHFSIVDRSGNAVAVTTTLNTSFGTGLMVTGAGFLLNNEMDDFAAAPGSPNYYGLIQSAANAVRGGARPLSSMTPTIVISGDSVRYVLGSPGGPLIITSVLQALLNLVDHRMNIQEAVDYPRVHHQWWPDTLYVEPRGLAPEVRQRLAAMGQKLGSQGPMGSVQGIEVECGGGGARLLRGGSDSRKNGCAVGVSGGRLVCRGGECRGGLREER